MCIEDFCGGWDNRKPKLQHEYAMAGFALSVLLDIWNHAHATQPGILGTKVRKAIKIVVRKLPKYPYPNKAT